MLKRLAKIQNMRKKVAQATKPSDVSEGTDAAHIPVAKDLFDDNDDDVEEPTEKPKAKNDKAAKSTDTFDDKVEDGPKAASDEPKDATETNNDYDMISVLKLDDTDTVSLLQSPNVVNEGAQSAAENPKKVSASEKPDKVSANDKPDKVANDKPDKVAAATMPDNSSKANVEKGKKEATKKKPVKTIKWQIPADPKRGRTEEQTEIIHTDIDEDDFDIIDILNHRKLKKGVEGEYLCEWNTGEILYTTVSFVKDDAPGLVAIYNKNWRIDFKIMELGKRKRQS